MRYQCLVLDHDDTVMDSTGPIHYPAFLEGMRELRPDVTMTLEDYFRMNFHPGFQGFMDDVLHLTPEEAAREYRIWQDYVATHIPKPYPGMAHLIRRFTDSGGIICVSSHSVNAMILRDYRANQLPEPALIYGWELPKEKRKPDPYALYRIMEKLSLKPGDLLMVDDAKPGYDMASAAGVDFAAACWAHQIPEIVDYMRSSCSSTFLSPEALEAFIFEEDR